jgi:folate-binding protein YgfZ
VQTPTLTPPTLALGWSVIAARGSQSEPFLQGQLTQDLGVLDHSGAWSLILRPDSVVITSCFVRRVEGGLDLVVPSSLGDVALTRLRRFLLRVDCTLELAADGSAPFATVGDLVSAGWPGPAEFAAELTPHSFGASFVASTISFTKGCYTGQELVGRLDARAASVPWRLVRASGANLARVDGVLRSKGPVGPQGVSTAVAAEPGVRALGFAHRTLLAPWVLDGITDVVVEAL